MSGDALFVMVLLAVTAGLMASNRVRYDVVALMVVVTLMLSGILTVPQAVSGFGNPVVILVAGMLVLGEMLARTGVAQAMGDWILARGGRSETRLLVLVMLGTAVLSSVMVSSAVVAIFVPIVMRIASRAGLDASRLLMPMSFAALIGGTLTLIGTNPNIVVNEELKESGFEGFGFFGFTPVGLAILAVVIVYVLALGRRQLSRADRSEGGDSTGRALDDLWEDYRTTEEYRTVEVPADSALVGRTIGETVRGGTNDVVIVGHLRRKAGGEARVAAPDADTRIQARDRLVVVGAPASVEQLRAAHGLTHVEKTERERQRWLWELGAAGLLIPPESPLKGRALAKSDFEETHGVHVLGMRRRGRPVEDYRDVPLRSADGLFVVGPWSRIEQLQRDRHDVIVTELPREKAEIVPAYRRMPIALGILLAMVAVTVLDILPLLPAVLLACLAAIATRCLTVADAYRAMPWSILVLIAGMFPLADALEKTGGTQYLVDGLVGATRDAGPHATMAVLFLLTAGMSLVLSNVASAVLVAPIAIYAAAAMDVSPYPFCLAVIIAASSPFASPVSTPVVTLVVNPGRYRFVDFIKVGGPLMVLALLVTWLLGPILYPFR